MEVTEDRNVILDVEQQAFSDRSLILNVEWPKLGKYGKYDLDKIRYLLWTPLPQIVRETLPKHQPLNYKGDPDIGYDFRHNLEYQQQWKAVGKLTKGTHHQAQGIAGIFTLLFYSLKRGANPTLVTNIWRNKLNLLIPQNVLQQIP